MIQDYITAFESLNLNYHYLSKTFECKTCKSKSQKMSLQNANLQHHIDINDFALQHHILLLCLERFQYDSIFFIRYHLFRCRKLISGCCFYCEMCIWIFLLFFPKDIAYFIVIITSLRDVS